MHRSDPLAVPVGRGVNLPTVSILPLARVTSHHTSPDSVPRSTSMIIHEGFPADMVTCPTTTPFDVSRPRNWTPGRRWLHRVGVRREQCVRTESHYGHEHRRHGEHTDTATPRGRRRASVLRYRSMSRVSKPSDGSASGASHNIASVTLASDFNSASQCAHESNGRGPRSGVDQTAFPGRIRSGRR